MSNPRLDPYRWRFILDEWVCDCDNPPAGAGFLEVAGDVAAILDLPRPWVRDDQTGELVAVACPNCGALSCFDGAFYCCILCSTCWLPTQEPPSTTRSPPDTRPDHSRCALGAERLPGL